MKVARRILKAETAGSQVMYFFRYRNSPKSCQHFKGEVERGRSSTGGVADIQGKTVQSSGRDGEFSSPLI